MSSISRIRCPLAQLLFLLSLIALQATRLTAGEVIDVKSALLRLIQEIEVPARAPGTISSMQVVEGDLVSEGSLLAQIDDLQAGLLHRRALIEVEMSQARVENDVATRSARIASDFHRDEFARLHRAATGIPGSVSLSELEETRWKLDQTKLDLRQAEHDQRVDQLTEKLKRQELKLSEYDLAVRKVRAPCTGIVVEVLRHPGEWVEPGEKVLRIVRTDRLRAEGLVHVRDISPNLKGAPVEILVDLPDRPPIACAGEVVFIKPEVNPVNGHVIVWAEFDNPDGRLMPGLRATLKIQATSRNSLQAASRPEE